MEWLHCPAFDLPEFIHCRGDEVLVMTDHQHTALEGCQALCAPKRTHIANSITAVCDSSLAKNLSSGW